MKDIKIHMVRAMCGVQLKDRKRATDLILLLSLNETVDQFDMVNSVHWYGDVLRREDGHVIRMVLDFEGQKKKGRPKWSWKKQIEEECEVGLSREDTLC